MKKILIAMLTLVTALGFSAPAALADTAFQPNLVGTVSVDPVGQSDINQKWTLAADGTAAPLGPYHYQSNLVVHMQNGVPDFAEGQGTFTGTGTSTGDSISFNLKLTFSSPTTGPYPYPFIGTFTVTGGTGRFQGVHGEGNITAGGANPTAGTFFGNWDGFVKSTTF